MKEERCENCMFYHRLKHNFETGKGFIESHACDVLLHVPDTNDEAWIQEVEPWDRCELFSRKVKD